MANAKVDYDRAGIGYFRGRREDPRIATQIHRALGDARMVLNVGAGTGSYEPRDRYVLAIEPSATMRAQRRDDAPPAIAAAAESLPLDDDSVDASMALATIHHWEDRSAGLAEMRRVTRGPVVVFTFDLDALPAWQLDYFAESVAADRARIGTVEQIAAELGGKTRVEKLSTPADCSDGFVEAYWNRPEAFLDPAVRASQSIWARVGAASEREIVARLRSDLDSGAWDDAHGSLRGQESFEGALRLIVSEP